MATETITGSWKANRDGRISANAYAICSDILTLDNDGRVFRQFDTTKVVDNDDNLKEKYRVIVTLVGRYTLESDVLRFSDMNPRFENAEYSIEGSSPEKKKALDTTETHEKYKAILKSLIAEVMMNKALECQQGNSGNIPPCHVRVENNQLVMKWEGYDAEDRMNQCEEPANLNRTEPAIPVEEALNSVANRFFRAVTEGDCTYLNNVTLLMPCGIEKNGNNTSIKIEPLVAGNMKLIVVFTDKVTMEKTELKQGRMGTKPVYMHELSQLMGPFDGICVNPVNGKSICLRQEMVEAMANGKWGGIDDKGHPVIQ